MYNIRTRYVYMYEECASKFVIRGYGIRRGTFIYVVIVMQLLQEFYPCYSMNTIINIINTINSTITAV